MSDQFKNAAAVLLLAEKIALGGEFHPGMTVTVPGGSVVMTPALIEEATRVALERNKHGYVGGAAEAEKRKAEK